MKQSSSSGLSQETIKVIQDLRGETVGLNPDPKATYKDVMNQEYSMRFKHAELLSVTRELVIPVHYKHLMELSKYLDNSLIYLK